MKALSCLVVVGALVALVASVPAAGQSSLGPGGTFLDDDFRAAEPAIEALVAGGITNGCGPELFCPVGTVTRGQMATFLGRTLTAGSSDVEAFSDLLPGSYYAGFVNRLFELGIVDGYPDGTFRPDAPVSRAEMAALLVRTVGLEIAGPGASAFIDVPSDGWFAPFVETLRNAGITTGCATDRFCPEESVTREQMALFLARAFRLPLPVVPGRTSPLNGLPATGLATERRVIAVKIDNAFAARPQSGIQNADAMMELMVEGGLSRMVGLFHHSDSTYVGPVRSVRPTDAVLESLGATVGISGAQPWISDLVGAEGVSIIREGEVGPPTLFRISGRVAPYNLYTSSVELRLEANRRGYPDEPPPALFNFGPFQYSNAPTATTINVSWSDPVSTVWAWDGARYRRSMGATPHFWRDEVGNSDRISADTLVVIFGQYYEVGPPPGVNGSIVPAMATIGSGRLLVFTNGRVLDGTWSRSNNETWFTFSVNGAELVVPPGIPWIHIIPHDRPVTWN
ncbi:MAG TPA: DUF3048 domain-containing protein [Acidimicrobiia bacterium]|nr:DUF3048 domain-containing protein [Acidimicrobiia bacterium]